MAKAITRRPGPGLAQCQLTYLDRTPIDLGLAQAQHAAYRAALQDAGASVLDLPALPDFPDSVFIEDALLAFPEIYILCRPGAVSRRGEPAALEPALQQDRRMARITPPGTLDGGDILLVGRTIYAGLSTRTNTAGIEQLRGLAEPLGYRVKPVAVRGALHLKTAVTALSDSLLLLNPRWVLKDAFQHLETIEIDARESGAANVLRVGCRLFVQSSYPATAQRIADKGFNVTLLDISEFAKAEAGLTCLSVIVPPT